jgi:predicted phage terminase large subunit-like protein
LSLELQNAVKNYENYIQAHGIDEQVINAYVDASTVAIKTEKDIPYGLQITKRAKEIIEQFCVKNSGGTIFDLEEYAFEHEQSYELINKYYEVLLLEAPHLFHSYLLYLEKNREESERFYQPKMKQLNKHGLIQAMQDLEDDKLDLLSISMPPGTQKTTLEKFFCSWIIGRHPKDYSLFFSHSDDITRMFYDGVLDITTNAEEYTWSEIFPNVKLQNTDAKRQRINFDKPKAFSNIQCTSVGSKNAGKVRCNRYLYCDDLISGIEEALNKKSLDKLWRIYGTDARQRKLNQQVKEIHIATRWSVHDVIGRLQRTYEKSNRVRFIAIPDIDPVTGKSNFDYKYNGMSVEFFHDQELTMDDISYRCLYKNEPIEREGLLYHSDDIRRFVTMPLREPDAILGICDVKNKGTDFMFLPCMYQYEDDFYLVDCICDDNTDYGIQYGRLSNIIIEHKMQQCEFESNSGGDRVSYEVAQRVEKMGGRCNITDKPTETNKETRIIVNADWVKKHVLFKTAENYKPKDDYGIMMTWLMTYSVVGKNDHDDVPDGLANFCLFVTDKNLVAKAEAAHNPFRRY